MSRPMLWLSVVAWLALVRLMRLLGRASWD